MPAFGAAPSLNDIDAIAREALSRLPEPFAGFLKDVVLVVDDFPPEDMLLELGIEDPFELTGLYSGRPAQTEAVTGDLPAMIHLFRRPIMEEWVDSEVPLEELVAHVLIHEAGHHFGLSDDDMEWMEEVLNGAGNA